MNLIFALVSLLLLAGSPWVLANTYAVGLTGSCNTHVSLTDALAAAEASSSGPHLIKLRSGELMTGGISLDQPAADITIEGGYTNCSEAAPPAAARMVIRQINPERVLRFDNASDTRRTLELRHITLTGGNESISDVLGGGGALVLQNATLILGEATLVENNRAGNGGGVSLFGTPTRIAQVIVTDGAEIRENTADGNGALGNGGGVFALDNAEVRMIQGKIQLNEARRRGGGVALNTARTAFFSSPPVLDSLLAPVVVLGNTAGTTFSSNSGFGGAIYTKEGNITISAPAIGRFTTDLTGNTANFGGAIYADGNADSPAPFTFISLRNTFTGFNTARGKGGAFYSANAVDWVLDTTAPGERCAVGPRYGPCSAVVNNTAYNDTTPGSPGAGVGYIYNDSGSQRGIFRFSRTLFEENLDFNGQVAVAMAFGTSEMIFERCILVDNEAGAASNATLLANAPGINLRFVYNTALQNDVDTLVFMNGGVLRNQGSIMWAPGSAVWTPTAGATMENNACLIAHQSVPGTIVANPRLAADFTPRGRSPAIDFCDNEGVTAGIDVYRQAPGYDAGGIDEVWGSNDLGAVENRDILFFSGFGNDQILQ
jgi:predicted outer membrane repeat protein